MAAVSHSMFPAIGCSSTVARDMDCCYHCGYRPVWIPCLYKEIAHGATNSKWRARNVTWCSHHLYAHLILTIFPRLPSRRCCGTGAASALRKICLFICDKPNRHFCRRPPVKRNHLRGDNDYNLLQLLRPNICPHYRSHSIWFAHLRAGWVGPEKGSASNTCDRGRAAVRGYDRWQLPGPSLRRSDFDCNSEGG